MSTRQAVIGVDPGPVAGLVLLDWHGKWVVKFAQADPDTAMGVVHAWRIYDALLTVEDFRVGNRTTKLNDPKSAEATRDMVGALKARYPTAKLRTASEVKPWATDERLKKAGLYFQGSMRHARDAARHALFCAVKDCGLPDPLSKKWPY